MMPAMFRVRDAEGQPVSSVEVDGEFAPVRRRVMGPRVTAAGLCVIHWPRDARSLRVILRAGGAEAEVVVQADRPDPTRALEVRLMPAEVAAE